MLALALTAVVIFVYPESTERPFDWHAWVAKRRIGHELASLEHHLEVLEAQVDVIGRRIAEAMDGPRRGCGSGAAERRLAKLALERLRIEKARMQAKLRERPMGRLRSH
jgi:hypothetical protein